MSARAWLAIVGVVVCSAALAQQAPPPPPSSSITLPAPPPGLSVELAAAAKLVREGQYEQARTKVDAVLAGDTKNPQARFIRGVIETDEGDSDEAIATFQGLTEDYPELPEPHNNLAVIWAKRGSYDKARIELETALAINPNYAIAHENLGDVYSRLAGAEFEHATTLDKGNKSAQEKLKLVRELFAVAPSEAPPKPVVPKPAAKPKPKK
ncbi:MAG TPA: tetratricopeptide repeat protein [Casimicrobiaceae bacterium]|jgi:Flp pilus assembly protein TadD|nr:tetratricopeptide repeat protein [Casimicrobiaceae bacterium]